MTGDHAKSRISPEILDQAATWFVEFQEEPDDLSVRQAFVRWLRISPEHVRGYLEIAATWEDARLIDHEGKDSADILIARALERGNIVPIELLGDQEQAHSPAILRRYDDAKLRRKVVTFTASIAMLAVGIGFVWYAHVQIPTYSTEVGEQRLLRLDDGSTVELNARSKIRVRFNDKERVVELIEGQALFNVAKDANRQFVVNGGGATVTAVGTQFEVYRRTTGTTVTVLEGRVAVAGPETAASLGRGGGGPLLVAAGEQVTITPMRVMDPRPVNVAASTAWTRREFVFQATPLSEVAEEFNRYNKRRLIVTDERIASTHISGVFSSSDPTALLLFLQSLPEFQVEEEGDTIRISGR